MPIVLQFLMILLIAGGAVLLLVIGLGLGFLIFGGQQSDPSEEVEQIIERTNPEAAARAKAAEKAEESEAGEGEEGEETGPPQKIAKISHLISKPFFGTATIREVLLLDCSSMAARPLFESC